MTTVAEVVDLDGDDEEEADATAVEEDLVWLIGAKIIVFLGDVLG